MAISIHHGSNGSYKTAGVVQDYLIPAIKSGRHVVTNIRGVSRDRAFDLIPDCHPDFDVTFVDTDTSAGRDRIARFWHWSPLGALLLFDEAGVLFPKRWKDSDLKKLDFPQGETEGRPITFTEAFEMHRHYNWDIVLSAPNISLLRADIRATTEGAYKHRNNAMIGMKGSYNEGFHAAAENGSNPNQFYTVRRKKIKPLAFSLYESTRTGKAQDTTATTSLLYNGRLMFSLVILISAIGYVTFNLASNGGFNLDASSVPPTSKENRTLDNDPNIIKASNLSNNNVSRVKDNGYYLEPFAGATYIITASLSSSDRFLYFFDVMGRSGSFSLTSTQLIAAGYSVIRVTDCAATIVFKSHRQNVTCGSSFKEAKKLGA